MAKPHAQQTKGTLQDFLREFLSKLKRSSGGLLDLQRQVAEEVEKSDAFAVKRFKDIFGASQLFPLVNATWHSRLSKDLEYRALEPPQEAILCAFGQVEDNVVKQDGLKAFLQWSRRQPGFDVHKVNHFLTSWGTTEPSKNIKDVNEAVASILYCLTHRGGKVTITNADLRTTIRQEINRLGQRGLVKKCLGGAPAIISDTLAQLGMPRVHLHTMYHSDAMACLHRGQSLRLDLNPNPPQPICVNQPDQFQVGGNTYPHPTRSSYIFAYKQGHTIKVGNQSFTAIRDDRIILRSYGYIGDHEAQWTQVQMKLLCNGQPTQWLNGPPVDKDEWPFFPGFVRWEVKNHVLGIECLDESGIKQIRNHDYVILNAPGFLQRSDPLDSMEAESLHQQFQWLADGPARIHLEISGGADPAQDRIQPFAQAVKGLIQSVGINDGELLQVTELQDYDPPVTVRGGTSEIYHRYERALRLAQELELERLYVHGNDVDLLLRREGSAGDMRAEIQADLFVKGIVVLAVLQRSVSDWRGYLQADYATAIAHSGIGKAQEQLDKDIQDNKLSSKEEAILKAILSQAEDNLKDAKGAFRKENFAEAEKKAQGVQKTIEQAFGIAVGPGHAAISLSPILLAKGFKTLIEFAYDFVRFTLCCNDPRGLTKEGEVIFQRIVETGYYLMGDPGGYSVAMVPVMWPELPVELNPTGAGDICSGVTAVYSGF